MILRLFKISSIVLLTSTGAWANDIFITQSGDDLDLTIVQKGGDNTIKQYDYSSNIEGKNIIIVLDQEHSNTGTNGNNVIEYWHLDGDDGSVEVRQGSDNYNGAGVRSDSTEYSGHHARVDYHGNGHSIRIGQRNPDDSPHSATVGIYGGNDSSVQITQGSSGSKSADVVVYNSDSNIDILQHYTGDQSASVTTYGSQPSNLSLEQQGSASSYSLTQDCQTTGGCYATVTQN